MNRIRTATTLVAVTASLAGLGVTAVVTAGTAGAAADLTVGKQVLDWFCEAKGGTPATTPYTIARCHEARPVEGFEIEQLICEGLLEGTFSSAPSYYHPSRVTWACFPGPLAP